jgi:hypothetical protein
MRLDDFGCGLWYHPAAPVEQVSLAGVSMFIGHDQASKAPSANASSVEVKLAERSLNHKQSPYRR